MIEEITAKNFSRYGWVIEYPQRRSASSKINLFRIVLRERKKSGWRIAYLVVRDKQLNRLEQHPGSYESFEPVRGRSILFVATAKDETKIKAFYLDVPIILRKGIWHGIITCGKETDVKISENANVQCVYWKLSHPLSRYADRAVERR